MLSSLFPSLPFTFLPVRVENFLTLVYLYILFAFKPIQYMILHPRYTRGLGASMNKITVSIIPSFS